MSLREISDPGCLMMFYDVFGMFGGFYDVLCDLFFCTLLQELQLQTVQVPLPIDFDGRSRDTVGFNRQM